MNTSEPESRWDEEQIDQLLTRFFRQELPAEFRDAPSPVSRPVPRLARTAPVHSSTSPVNSGSAGAILGLVAACLGLMVLAMVQTGTPDPSGDPVADTQVSTPAEPAAPPTVQNPDSRTQPKSAVNWQNSAPDSEPSADPLLQELDIQIFPLESERQGDKEKGRQGDR